MTSRAGFHAEFACEKTSGKVRDHMTMGLWNCNKCEPVAKCPDHDPMTTRVLKQLNFENR